LWSRLCYFHCTTYLLRKCSLEIELRIYDQDVWWSALGISRATTLAKQLSYVGSCFRGDLGLLVWRKRVPNLFGISKCILYFYNLGFHQIPVGGLWASFVKLPEGNHLKSWILQLQSHYHCWELLYYVTLGCMGSTVHPNCGAAFLCKALICQSRSVDAHDSEPSNLTPAIWPL
jgi:hypothetical protein